MRRLATKSRWAPTQPSTHFRTAALTGKIKAKITLDDTLKGSNVGVDSNDGAVTLTGTVASPAQHTRVLQLTKETDGVKSVADHLIVR